MRHEGSLLPLTTDRLPSIPSASIIETPTSMTSGQLYGLANGHVRGEEKRADAAGPGRPRAGSRADIWLPPGTRQEETWRPSDIKAGA